MPVSIKTTQMNVKDNNEYYNVDAIEGPPGPKGPRGLRGSSGVYYGTEPPEDSEINVWVDPSGENNIFIDDEAGEGDVDKTWSANKIVATLAPAIKDKTVAKSVLTPTDIVQYDSCTIVCDATNYNTIYVANTEDIYPSTDATSSTEYTKESGNTIVYNGTISSEKYYYSRVDGVAAYVPSKEIKNGDTVNMIVNVEGTIGGTPSSRNKVEFYFLRSDNTQISKTNVSLPSSTGIATASYTATENVAKVRVYVVMYGGVFDNFKISWGGTIGTSYSAVAGGSEIEFDVTDYRNDGFSVLPAKASIKYTADTKTYIDNYIPDNVVTESDLIYLSPEMYGAVGNGVSNDATAIQNCINDAVSTGKPVRGFGQYKITSTITMDGINLSVYFKSIVYSGNNTAINIAGRNNDIQIDYLQATSTGAIGINLIDSQVAENTERIFLSGTAIYASGNAIRVTAGENHMIMFVNIRYKYLTSALSQAIYSTGFVSELSVYDARFGCTNSWCFEGKTVKLFNCTMETNCWGGVYASSATIQNCRAREMMDCLMASSAYYGQRSGILFKLKNNYTHPGIKIFIDDCVYYDAIDLSEAIVPNDGTGEFASQYNGYTGFVNGPIIYGDLTYKNGEFILGKEMILHGKDKVCVPQFRSIWTVDTQTFDLRDETYLETWDGTRPPYPTKFIIGVDDCEIYLSPSYCSEGYSEFIVDMSTYMATIYDRRGNVLFDPTDYTAGVYKFTASVDHTIDDVYQADHSGQHVYPINSGYCDVWDIEEIS